MGCDIHIVVEHLATLAGEEPKWIGLHNCPYHTQAYAREEAGIGWSIEARNYSLFADLAGVRGVSELYPDAAPQGLPDEPSDLTKLELDRWGGDAHSVSWMPMDEAFVKWGVYLANVVKAKVMGVTDFDVTPGSRWTVEDTVRWKMANHFGIDVDDADDAEAGDDHRRTIDKYRVVFWFDN